MDTFNDKPSVLTEADNLINGERRADYGDAYDSFVVVARLWSVVLGIDVTPRHVALCMIMLKVGRDITGERKRDTLVDMAGYTGLLDHIYRTEERIHDEVHDILKREVR
jgi:hypothetical protein